MLICENISNSALIRNILEYCTHLTVSKMYTQYRALFDIFAQFKKMYENLAIFSEILAKISHIFLHI